MIKGFPCKVIDYSTAKPGKHGSSKATIVGTDIFTNKKYEDACPTSATVLIPTVNKIEYEVADIDEDNFVYLILPNGELKCDLKMPVEDDEIYTELKKFWEESKVKDGQAYFTVQSACKMEKLVSGRLKAD